ncbi:MAG: acyltransferase [Chryseobacterium sp.]|nr:acyltransferase [Candidatus Chryseobacterium enterohippi]
MISSLLQKLQRKSQLSTLNKHPKVKYGAVRMGVDNHFNIHPRAKNLTIGSKLNLRNYVHFFLGENAECVIEENVFMNNFCSVNCLQHIFIGENTLFGENVKIYDHNHVYTRSEPLQIKHQEFTSAPIHIGKNCWLGSNVTILKGVTIGDNAIIGAGCTIFKDVPANTTVVNSQVLIEKSRL